MFNHFCFRVQRIKEFVGFGLKNGKLPLFLFTVIYSRILEFKTFITFVALKIIHFAYLRFRDSKEMVRKRKNHFPPYQGEFRKAK